MEGSSLTFITESIPHNGKGKQSRPFTQPNELTESLVNMNLSTPPYGEEIGKIPYSSRKNTVFFVVGCAMNPHRLLWSFSIFSTAFPITL